MWLITGTRLVTDYWGMQVDRVCTGQASVVIFKVIFRTALPLLKRGFSVAKPHLKFNGTWFH